MVEWRQRFNKCMRAEPFRNGIDSGQVPTSDVCEIVEDGCHAATPFEFLSFGGLSGFAGFRERIARMQSAARCALPAAWTIRRLSFELGNPVLDVSGGVAVGVFVGNSSDSAKKGRAHLCYQFLLAVKLISEVVAKGAI